VVLESTSKLVRALPKRDFQLLLVGLDPHAQLEDGRRQRDALAKRLGWPELPYLSGKQSQVAALADAVGYRYAWDARTEQYAHPAVLIVLDGRGRVHRYLHALGTTSDQLAAALQGGSPTAPRASLAGDLLSCFRFDPALRRHQRTIELYFRVGGALIFMLLASLVVGLSLWERRRRA
jgi:protein SCO1/2